MASPFDHDHQTAIGDLDITYAKEGLTLSGRLRMPLGPEGAETARNLAKLLLDASSHLQESAPVPEENPKKVDSPFGHAFD